MIATQPLTLERAPAQDQSPSTPAPGVLVPLLLAVLLTAFCAAPPRVCTKTDVDSSWCAVLDYAHAHHLQFGKDIVFTYGPLGFLVTPFYSSAAGGLRLAVAALLCFSAAFAISLLAWRLELLWRALLLGAFILVIGNTHSGADVLLNLSLVSWGLLCVLEQRRRLTLAVSCFTAIAAFSVMVKLTYLISSGVSITALTILLALRGRRALALGLPAGFAVGVMLLWVAAGQSLQNFKPYLASAGPVCGGFDQAMATDCPLIVFAGGILLILLALLAAALRAVNFDSSEGDCAGAQRFVLFGWLASLFFVTWKHGFVRADRSHIEYFLFFVPVVLLALEALPLQKHNPREWARALAAACCVLAALILQPMFFPGYLQYCLQRPWRAAPENARTLLNPQLYLRQMDQQFEQENHKTRLPRISAAVGQASVDVFGWAQTFAVLNGLSLRPRPVFQSYAAYDARLMSLNEAYYLSPDRPQFVLFSLSSLDDRLPALDDAPLLRDLLANYQLVDGEDSLLLLKAVSGTRPKLSFLREGTVHAGEPIRLPGNNANVWMELSVQPTMLGRARRLLYRPGRILLQAHGGRGLGRDAQFGAPVPMLAAGFLASPLLLGNADVVDIYRGKLGCRPEAYSVELPPEDRRLWQESISFRLYELETELGHSAPDALERLKFPGFQLAPSELNSISNFVVLDKGKPLLRCAGHKIYPLDVLSGSNLVLSVNGKPGLLLRPGGSMRFKIPAGAAYVHGRYGVADGSISEPAEFRVEQQLPDGTSSVLLAQQVALGDSPEQRGFKEFRLPLRQPAGGTILIRSVAPPTDKDGQVLSCWADLGFAQTN